MKKNKSVCIANIGKPRGLKGEFFLNSFCSPKENILNYINDIFIENENKLSIEYIKKSNSKFLAKLKNIDSVDEINKKIKKAKSDSEPIPDDIKLLEKKPEALNLLTIYAELSKTDLKKTISEMSGKEYSFLKTKLAEVLIEEIAPVSEEIKKLLDDRSHLKKILKKGSEKANIIAEENLKNIREKVGLI